VLGVLLGMLLFWVVFPVEWTDANSYDLSPEAKAIYVGLVADSYKLNRDPTRAAELLAFWEPGEKQLAFQLARQLAEAEDRSDKLQTVTDLAMVLGIGEAPAPPLEQQPGILDRLRVPCLVFVLVLLVLVLAWIGLRVLMQQRSPAKRNVPAAPPVRDVSFAPADVKMDEEFVPAGSEILGRFVTTYKLGEDTYDESFSIETPMGEFLGECGVGISETIGVSEPDRVTAFEVWLFDKSDIRTVTKVLMSDHAYNDGNLRARLASKGEPVLAQANVPFTLETSGLQVEVNLTELEYGEGDQDLDSFFSRLTIELEAKALPAESDVKLV
jgi:hypothetical protein